MELHSLSTPFTAIYHQTRLASQILGIVPLDITLRSPTVCLLVFLARFSNTDGRQSGSTLQLTILVAGLLCSAGLIAYILLSLDQLGLYQASISRSSRSEYILWFYSRLADQYTAIDQTVPTIPRVCRVDQFNVNPAYSIESSTPLTILATTIPGETTSS